MGVPEEDFAARSRSVFERLRQEQTGEPDEAVKPVDASDAREDGESGAWQVDEGDAPSPADPPPAWSTPDHEAAGTGEGDDADTGAIGEFTPDTGEAGQELAPETDIREQPGVEQRDEPAPGAVAPPSPEPMVVPEAPVEADVIDLGANEPDLVISEAVEPPAPEPEPAPQPPLDPMRFVRPLPRVLAIANQKGGVGKTTTTVNLGASLAVLGYRVLVIDLDPQGNATTGLGINSRNLDGSIYDVILHDLSLDDCVEPTALKNLFVAPATIDLAGAEIELVPAFSRELRLRRALEGVQDDYDFVLVDCPPSLGLLTVNALSAAGEVVVPIQCEYYALEGLGQLLRNVNLVQSNLNPRLELSAIVLTMYDARTKLAEQVADEVREHFGEKVCRIVVPRTVRLSEAPSFGQPIIVFDPSSRGALAYRELAMEVSGGPPQRTG